MVALDWTEFAKSDHSTLVLSVIAHDKRATPVLWKTAHAAESSELPSKMSFWSDSVRHFSTHSDHAFGRSRLRKSCHVSVLRALQIDFVIRFKSSLLIGSSDGEMQPAAQHIPKHGRTYSITSAHITSERAEVPHIVLKHAKGMKESWCLASSRADLKPSEVVNLYGRRFTIEERFRDIRMAFRNGVSAVQMESTQRRDRLLPYHRACADPASHSGAAGEALGMSRLLKANTVKSRVHSLYRQAKPICNFSQTCPKSSPAPPPFPRITASARQNLKTSRPTVANVPSRKFGDRQGTTGKPKVTISHQSPV